MKQDSPVLTIRERPRQSAGPSLSGAREFFNSPAGKGTAIGIFVFALVIAFFSIKSNVSNDANRISADRMFMDSTTGKPFEHTLAAGDRIPLKAPSGGNTGYPAEPCYWTKDGKIKPDPTFVLLNQYKGVSGPTFCPDCGRLVVAHNPPPSAGAKPPPTKEEYDKRNNRSEPDRGDGR
jgi:hypothetical protein